MNNVAFQIKYYQEDLHHHLLLQKVYPQSLFFKINLLFLFIIIILSFSCPCLEIQKLTLNPKTNNKTWLNINSACCKVLVYKEIKL